MLLPTIEINEVRTDGAPIAIGARISENPAMRENLSANLVNLYVGRSCIAQKITPINLQVNLDRRNASVLEKNTGSPDSSGRRDFSLCDELRSYVPAWRWWGIFYSSADYQSRFVYKCRS